MRGLGLTVPFVAFALAASAAATSDIPLPVRKPKVSEDAPPPVTWTVEQISRAQEECARLIAPIELLFEPLPPVRDGACGTPVPILVKTFGSKERIHIKPPAQINCALTAKLNVWLTESVLPLAKMLLKSPIVEIHNVASYACRNRYNDPSKRLSEHALANALDIAAFKTANGEWIRILDHWGLTKRDLIARAKAKAAAEAKAAAGKKAAEQKAVAADTNTAAGQSSETPPPLKVSLQKTEDGTQGTGNTKPDAAPKQALKEDTPPEQPAKPDPHTIFVRKIYEDACRYFGTVLGPEANDAHRNHFHLDLAPRKRSAYCE
ncbi:hypothetical protein MnTg02_01756 [bacterium MnTg02]|nr:hypothetical protein MnTg02_01756 [bacterium MnTg02]